MNKDQLLGEKEVAACLAAASDEARANQWNVSVGLVDAGGHLLGFLRQSQATPLSASIAVAKARTAALSRRETRFFEELVAGGKTGFLSVPDMTPLEGGFPIFVDGACVGGIAVSGATSPQDAQVARAGLAALSGADPTTGEA
jgi:glc operon protein GlcG